MKILEEFSKCNIIRYFIVFVIFISWLLPYTNKGDYLFYENFGLVFISLIAFLCLLLFKDTYYIIEIILLVPFMFSHEMGLYTIPPILYFLVGFVILGFFIHILLYKQKLKLPKFFFGFLLIAISLVLGGLLIPDDDRLMKVLVLLFIALAFLIFYIFLTSSTKANFDDLVSLMTMLGLLLCVEIAVYAFLNPNDFIFNKRLNLGWAVNANSVAMILLLCFPFTLYNALRNKGLKMVTLFIHLFMEIIAIILTYSRGAIFSAFIAFVIFDIILCINKQTRKKMLTFTGLSLVGCGIVMLSFFIFNKEMYDSIIQNVTKIDLESLNGRLPIYQKMFSEIKEQPIFGYGVFALYSDANNNPNDYLWAHNTFLHATYTLGFVGFGAMIIHHFEKYFHCIHKMDLKKMILLFAFIASDIYGFFDVNYFFVNFMIVLVVIFILSNDLANFNLFLPRKKQILE